MGKLDINTATLEEIERIHGIGHGRARQIVEYRQRHGGIRRLEELLELPLFRSASPEDRQALTDSFLVTAATLPVSVAGKLDLNRANRGDLEQIRGIGERRIETLLDYRRRHRGFRSLDELDALPGFEDMDPIDREAIKAHLTLE